MTVTELALKLFIYIAIGFVARKTKVMSDGFDKMLTKFVMAVPLPIMIINSFRIEFSKDELSNFPLIIGLSLLFMLASFIIGEIVRRILGGGKGKTARFALMFTNFTFFGLAVVSDLYGQQAVFYYVVFTLPIRVMFYAGAPLLLGGSGEKLDKKTAARQLVSAPVLSVFIGLILYVTQLQLPRVLDEVMVSVGSMASPLGLMLCGTVLADAKLRGVFKYPSVFVISILRLILVPAVVLALSLLLRLDDLMTKTLLFYFAMPVASLLPVFYLRYNPDDGEAIETAGYVVAISTLLSMITIPMWAHILELI